MFDPSLVKYTEEHFKRESIHVLTRSAVVGVDPSSLSIKSVDSGSVASMPYGVLLWASGITTRPVTKKLMERLGNAKGGPQENPRGLTVDKKLRVKGGEDRIFALGDCALAGYAPTAQVAAQQGKYLGETFNALSRHFPVAERAPASEAEWREELEKRKEFAYTHNGALAYVGSKTAIYDYRDPAHNKTGEEYTSKGWTTWILWRSVYLSKLLSVRNRVLVATDWIKTSVFGRDVSRGV
jgi:NADH:ubiquinone reductase (non-electrogenic)